MTGFWILGGLGVLILIEYACIDRAAKRAFKRGYDEGKSAGHLETDIWWLKQGAEVQKAREQIWREQ